jgi:hypothetical protein
MPIELAERVRVAVEAHTEERLREAIAAIADPEERAETAAREMDGKTARNDRTRYFEELERVAARVLEPVQDLLYRLERDGKAHALEGVPCWCEDQLRPHSELCRFVSAIFRRLETRDVASESDRV